MSEEEAWNLGPEKLARMAAFIRIKEQQEDERFGVLAATIANFAGMKAAKHHGPEDFFWRLRKVNAKPKRKLSVKELTSMLKRWSACPTVQRRKK